MPPRRPRQRASIAALPVCNTVVRPKVGEQSGTWSADEGERTSPRGELVATLLARGGSSPLWAESRPPSLPARDRRSGACRLAGRDNGPV
jgi:hypothetical protein